MFGHGIFGFGGPLVMIVLWVAIISALVYLVRIMPWGGADGAAIREEPSALELLKSRYAAGELDSEEYERIKRDLVR